MNYYELFIDTKQLPKKSSKEEVLILFKKMKQGDIQLGYVIPSEIDIEDEYIEKDYNRMIYEYYETFEGTRSKGNNVIFWFL